MPTSTSHESLTRMQDLSFELSALEFSIPESPCKQQFALLVELARELLNQDCYAQVYHSGSVEHVDLLHEFISWVRELRLYIESQKPYNLCKLLIRKAERLAIIDGYHARLTTIMSNFQWYDPYRRTARLLENLNDQFITARSLDQTMLNSRWNQLAMSLTSSKKLMAPELGFDGSNAVPIVARLKQYINDEESDQAMIRSIDFVISCLCVFTFDARVMELKPWMITSFDVDIGPLIGVGSMGKVFRGRWYGKDVAIKMLKSRFDILPRSAYVDREMEKWSKLHHPNVLPFLGGNTLDNKPFVVLPFLKHQTSRDYIQKYPDCNRLRLLYETSLGLLYLHSEKIIHGNIKGLNILIDDDEKPRLCDYGFAKIKADINSRFPLDPASSPSLGSRNWMAPELFRGGYMTFQCDIYSFGMTVYELLADHISFGHASPSDLYNLIVEKHIRPPRPDANEAPQCSDSAWILAEKCWGYYPAQRIGLPTLSAELGALLPSFAGDGLSNNPPSIPALPSVVPSTIALPQVSQPIGLE